MKVEKETAPIAALKQSYRTPVLDAWLHKYRTGTISKAKLETALFLFIRKNFNLYVKGWVEEEILDFMSWFYPRLKTAIERYQDRGYSFDTYIASLVRLSAKEYKRKDNGRRYTESSYWDCATAHETEKEEHQRGNPEADCLHSLNSHEQAQKLAAAKPSNPRQILILLLKSYHIVQDDFVHHVAKSIGLKSEELQALVKKMKELREEDDKRCWLVRERVHSQYYRLMAYEYRLNATSPDSVHYNPLKDRVRRHRIRLENLRLRYSKMRKGATNQQVADVLGVPKGTIDAALFAVKKKYNLSSV